MTNRADAYLALLIEIKDKCDQHIADTCGMTLPDLLRRLRADYERAYDMDTDGGPDKWMRAGQAIDFALGEQPLARPEDADLAEIIDFAAYNCGIELAYAAAKLRSDAPTECELSHQIYWRTKRIARMTP